MAVAAFSDDGMLRHMDTFDFGNRMACKTVISAIGHFIGVCRVAFNAGLHSIVARIGIDRFEKRGMTAHTIPRTSPQRQQQYKK